MINLSLLGIINVNRQFHPVISTIELLTFVIEFNLILSNLISLITDTFHCDHIAFEQKWHIIFKVFIYLLDFNLHSTNYYGYFNCKNLAKLIQLLLYF